MKNLFVLFMIIYQPLSADEKMPKKITIALAKGHITHILASKVVEEAYKRLGIEVVFLPVSGKRTLTMTNNAKADAEVGRVPRAVKKFKNLLQVDLVPIAIIKGVVVASKDYDIKSWKDLKNYRVGIRRGELYVEKGTKFMKVYSTRSYEQLFNMLKNNRIDIAIGTLTSVNIVGNEEFKNSNLKIVGDPIVEIPLYHNVHKKYKFLIPKLNKILQQMLVAGDIDKINKRTFQEIVQSKSLNR